MAASPEDLMKTINIDIEGNIKLIFNPALKCAILCLMFINLTIEMGIHNFTQNKHFNSLFRHHMEVLPSLVPADRLPTLVPHYN